MEKAVVKKLINILPLAIVIVVFPFFFLGGALEESSNLLGALWDCGHLIFFIALVIALSKKFDVNNWRVGVAITAAVFCGGGLIEIIQAHIGRDGNWDDLLRDLTGTWLGLFWLQRSQKWVWLGRIASLALLAPTLTAVFFEAWFQFHAMKNFPLLAGFESRVELYGQKSTAELSPQFHTQGDYSLKLNLTTDFYSGISLGRFFNDWSGYKQLSFDIYNPHALPLAMTLRVNDIQHKKTGWVYEDRFNKRFQLNFGWNHLVFSINDIQRAPAKRLMDLSHVSLVVIFAEQLHEPQTIYLDNLRLK